MADDVADDFVDGGTGNDLISYAQFRPECRPRIGAEERWLRDTFTSIEDAEGTAYNDTIWGNAATSSMAMEATTGSREAKELTM